MNNKENLKVAIQGGHGSFHEIAAKQFFAQRIILIIPCTTFDDVFDALKNYKADCAVMAIENSIAGTLLPNYAKILETDMKVAGEQYIRIEQHLMALKSQNEEDITEIHSHPHAIEQCQDYLNKFRTSGTKIISSNDTAMSAKKISDEKLTGIAAIASELAAEMYGLKILQRNIETNKRNFTRFLLIGDETSLRTHNLRPEKKVNKSSVCFILQHKIGSLSQILSILTYYGLNLTKIQSLPIIGEEWKYRFYVDLVFNDYDVYRSSLNAIRPLLNEMTITGEYPEGNTNNI